MLIYITMKFKGNPGTGAKWFMPGTLHKAKDLGPLVPTVLNNGYGVQSKRNDTLKIGQDRVKIRNGLVVHNRQELSDEL